MKKVLYFDSTTDFGGAIVSLFYLINNIDKNKYKIILATSNKDNYIKNQFSRLAKIYYLPPNFTSTSNNPLITKLNSLQDYLLCRFPQIIRLTKIIKKENINIVHLNNDITCNLAGIVAAKICKIPIILHQRGNPSKSYLTKILLKNIDYYISVSNFIKKELISLNIDEKKITVVPEGLDLNEYKKVTATSLGDNKGVVKIGMVGCITPWKGQKNFIEAINILSLSKTPIPIKAFIIGNVLKKDISYYRHLVRLIKLLSLKEQIVFTGRRHDIPALLKYMDILIHCSIEPEPFGRVIIEAMAMGKPVIASQLGAPSEIIDDGINGFLVSPNNPQKLAQKIIRVVNLKKKNHLKNLCNQARKTIGNNYSIQLHVRTIEALYEKIL